MMGDRDLYQLAEGSDLRKAQTTTQKRGTIMKNRILYLKPVNSNRAIPTALMLAFVFIFLSVDASYAYLQEDPRIPAIDHPQSDSLAPAMARLNVNCTAWITTGGRILLWFSAESHNLPRNVSYG